MERVRLLRTLAQTCKGLKVPKALWALVLGSVSQAQLGEYPKACAAQGNLWGWVTLGLAPHKDNLPDCTWSEMNHSCKGWFSQLSVKTAEGNSCRPLCPICRCRQQGRNVHSIISATDLTWMESLRQGLIQPRTSFLAIGIKCFGVRCKKPAIICLEGRLVLVGIQQVLSFALDEYSNNLTVDVLILHIPMKEVLWL